MYFYSLTHTKQAHTMKSFRFCYSLLGRKTLVATYIEGQGKDLDEAYRDALKKVNEKHSSLIEKLNKIHGDCVIMKRSSGHEVNYYHS